MLGTVRKLVEVDPWRDWHTCVAGGLWLVVFALLWRLARSTYEVSCHAKVNTLN